MCFIAAHWVWATEAILASTSQSSFRGKEGDYLYPSSNLINGKGLSGEFKGDNCAGTNYGPTQWFSFELKVPQHLFSIKITPRLDPCCLERSQNISVTIGDSKSYDPKEPLCLKISQLVLQEGLTEYKCTGMPHSGKYVKIARGVDGSEGVLDICEVRIFTVGGNHTLLGGIIQSDYLWHSRQVYK